MEDHELEAVDLQREAEDELIRRYLLAEAIEWAEYQRVYGWMSKK